MLLALSAVPALLLVDIPEQRRFGDWIAVCDNVRRCEAVALPREDMPGDQVTVSVARSGDARALAVIEITGLFGEDLPPGSWRLDGRRITLAELPLLRALARARRAEWVLSSGKVHAALTVKGAAAALRWMDEQQGRAGGVTALVATGPRPAAAVPTPPALPSLRTTPRSTKPPVRLTPAAVADIRRKGDCDVEEGDVSHHRLDAEHSLALVLCNMGAYQGTSLAVVIPEDGQWAPAPIELPARFVQPLSDAWTNASITGADFDDAARSLGSWAKGRGLGDCGYSASWEWDGKAFRLASFAGLEYCRGSRAWPSMWQTANASRK